MASVTSSRGPMGPLLREVINAQRVDESVVGSCTSLSGFADALARRCRDLASPLVWPIGDAAERLAGAAIIVSGGGVRVRGWTDEIPGERVLLLAVAAVTPISILRAGARARALGAAEVHVCGVELVGLDNREVEAAFESCGLLVAPLAQRSMAATG
jgi:hypothetical protein